MKKAGVISLGDNGATVLEDIAAGEEVGARLGKRVERLTAEDDAPFGFKMALTRIARRGDVPKHGEVIGRASAPIEKGKLVHIHNVEGTRGRGDISKEAKGK